MLLSPASSVWTPTLQTLLYFLVTDFLAPVHSTSFPALRGPPITVHPQVPRAFEAVPYPPTEEHLNTGEGGCSGNPWHPGSKHSTVMHPVRTSATQAGTARASTPAGLVLRSGAGRPGHAPAGAPEGPVPGRGGVRRGGSGPRSLAKDQAHPLLRCVQTKPGEDPPETLHPEGPGLRLPQPPGASG